jgi:hypothetical protein
MQPWAAFDSPETLVRRARSDGRAFAFTIGGGFLVLALLAMRKQRHVIAAIGVGLAGAALVAGLVFPARLLPLRRRWMQIGELLGTVTTPIVMATVYYLLVTPAGILRRALRPRDKKPPSWNRREPLPPASRMERQF